MNELKNEIDQLEDRWVQFQNEWEISKENWSGQNRDLFDRNLYHLIDESIIHYSNGLANLYRQVLDVDKILKNS